MAVLERSELEASPLADLHAIADQLGLDGFRRLRKGALIDAILAGAGDAPEARDGAREEEPRDGAREEEPAGDERAGESGDARAEESAGDEREGGGRRRRRGGRSVRGRRAAGEK